MDIKRSIRADFIFLNSVFLIFSLLILTSCFETPQQKPASASSSSSPKQQKDPPPGFTDMKEEKPVIYIYPEKITQVEVTLDFDNILVTWPEFKEGQNSWKIEAHPGGLLKDLATGRTYNSLFWEGHNVHSSDSDWNKSWSVSGKETGEFLRKILLQKGLTEQETNEFIIYWLPRMKNNAYNQITFLEEIYNERNPLIITPKPDSLLRICMVFRALDKPMQTSAPEIKPFKRKGLCVVEWGGVESHLNDIHCAH